MHPITEKRSLGNLWIFALIAASVLFLYSSVIVNLVRQWWKDDNYSHGLLVPFLIALIVWQERSNLKRQISTPGTALGITIILSGLTVLLAGTLGAELFSQRISLLLVLSGIIVYLWGHRILSYLSVPFLLLFLAIPIPQIILNKLSFPLQLLATQAAQAGVSAFGISSTRKGNVIELIPYGSTTPVGLEVVEACSGIRSLVTLITLAVVLAYFGRTPAGSQTGGRPKVLRDRDLWRGALLVILAVPIALITNAARVFMTGLATYRFGAGVADSWWHDAFGWITFLFALFLLFASNLFLSRLIKNAPGTDERELLLLESRAPWHSVKPARLAVVLLLLLGSGALINWFQNRTEVLVTRKPLADLPLRIGNAVRPYEDSRFSPATEVVLGASDYIMRDYILPPRRFNLYVGYYSSQRAGATYHSPQHCLPGSGWEMTEGQTIQMTSPEGRQISANQYILRQGGRRYMMLYWYQGRGRANASEYWDKLYTIADSISRGRSDGAMVRVMTPIYEIETGQDASAAVKSFSQTIADSLTEYVPD